MYKLENREYLMNLARTLRKSVIAMLYHAESGHPGGALSSADIIAALYFGGVLKHFPEQPKSADRDYFILSAGHYCPLWYAVLAYSGYFPVDQLNSLRKHGSPLLGHPRLNSLPGIENSGGSLGQGISIAMGIAKGLKIDKKDNNVFCLMSDGEQNEGQVWEAASFAAHHKLDNLCGIIDVNKIQIDGFTHEVMNMEPLDKKYESFGWHVVRIDGHDFESIFTAFNKFSNAVGKPTVIIADTVAGKGVSFLEGTVKAHGKWIKENEYKIAMKELS
jgi:transketolase